MKTPRQRLSRKPPPDPLTRAINAEKRRQGAFGGGSLVRTEQVSQDRPPPRRSEPAPLAEIPIATPGPVGPEAPAPVETQPKILPWPTPMPIDPPPPTFRKQVSADLRELQLWFATREPLWQPLVVWAVKIATFAFALRLAGLVADRVWDVLISG